MRELHPCPDCHRHIRIDEDTCPFCDVPVETPASRRRLPVGRFTRAAVFSGAVLAATACSGDDDGPTPDANVTVADADVNAPDADVNAPDADPNAPDAGPTDAAPPDSFIPLPYGSPPARTRLV